MKLRLSKLERQEILKKRVEVLKKYLEKNIEDFGRNCKKELYFTAMTDLEYINRQFKKIMKYRERIKALDGGQE